MALELGRQADKWALGLGHLADKWALGLERLADKWALKCLSMKESVPLLGHQIDQY